MERALWYWMVKYSLRIKMVFGEFFFLFKIV